MILEELAPDSDKSTQPFYNAFVVYYEINYIEARVCANCNDLLVA